MSISAKAIPAAKRVVIVIYPGVTLLDAAGPAQVFSSANHENGVLLSTKRYEVVLASPDGGAVETDTGIPVGTVSLDEAARQTIDTLIVAGGEGIFDLCERPNLVEWVANTADECRRVASTCMGAFLTAEAGLLDGHRVTTHWRKVDLLEERYPEVHVECNPLFVRSGKMWSSAGVSAGIDLALALVEEDHGHDVAMQVAQALVVFFKRTGGQSQFSNILRAQKEDGAGRFSELHAWIAGNLHEELSVDELASRAGMSPRTFARHYRNRTGVTPAKSIELMRVEAAKRLLEQGSASMASVAAQTGLVDEQRMRRTFLRHVGVSPAEYRRSFAAHVQISA